jgi:hypothetical protein
MSSLNSSIIFSGKAASSDPRLVYQLSDKFKQLTQLRAQAAQGIHEFEQRDLYLKVEDPLASYHRRKYDNKNSVGWGQLKLAITEIQALIYFWDPKVTPQLVVVYAGAAPGHHFVILEKMFPTVEWHLYDPAKFFVQQSDRITIHNEKFTDEIAAQWSGRQDVFFFSDIRTIGSDMDVTDASGRTRKPTPQEIEDGIWSDMEAQQGWTEIMKPLHAQLKMRLPYIISNDSPKSSRYLNGYIMLQSFAGPTSTETRLVPIKDQDGNYSKVRYNNKKYESKLFYHNAVIREAKRYRNPIDAGTISSTTELDDKYDSTHMLYVLGKYMKFMGDPQIDTERVTALADVVMNTLSSLRTKPVSISIIRKEMSSMPERQEGVGEGEEYY